MDEDIYNTFEQLFKVWLCDIVIRIKPEEHLARDDESRITFKDGALLSLVEESLADLINDTYSMSDIED